MSGSSAPVAGALPRSAPAAPAAPEPSAPPTTPRSLPPSAHRIAAAPSVVSVTEQAVVDGMPCPACAGGIVRQVDLGGTVLPYRDVPDLIVPAFLAPQCHRCHQMLLTGEQTRAYSAMLESARATRLGLPATRGLTPISGYLLTRE